MQSSDKEMQYLYWFVLAIALVVETTMAANCSSASSINAARVDSAFDEVAKVSSSVSEGFGNDHYFCCQRSKDYH